MSISCSCDGGDWEWWWVLASDFSVLATKRARRCCACRTKLSVGAEVLEVTRWTTDTWGNEKPLASWWLCETCGGLAMALDGLQYCYTIDEPLKAQIKEYVEMYGPL